MTLDELFDKIRNNKLDTLSPRELDEALNMVSDDPSLEGVYQAIVDFKNAQEQRNESEIIDPAISEEDFEKNAENLRNLESQIVFGDEGNVLFDRIETVNNGTVENINLMDEILDAAKLSVKVSAVDEESGLTVEEYKHRLQLEIASILSTMIVVKPNDENQENNLTEAEQRTQAVANIFDPNFTGKIQIDKQAAGATFANTMGRIASRVNDLAQQYSSREFFADVANQFNDLDRRLDDKLEEAYAKTKATVAYMIKTGSWKQAAGSLALAGTAFVAAGTAVGVGALAGLTGMTAYMTYQRWREFWKGFKDENQNQDQPSNKKQKHYVLSKSFCKYIGNHKMEAVRIALYAGATIAGADGVYHAGTAVYQASQATAEAASAGTEAAEKVVEATLAAQEAQAAATAATTAKIGTLTTAAALPYASDAVTAAVHGEWKKARSSTAKAAAVIGGSLGLYWLFGGDHDAHVAEPNPTPAPTDSLVSDTTQVAQPVVEPTDTTQVDPHAGQDVDAGGNGGGDTDNTGGDAQASQVSIDEINPRVEKFYEYRIHKNTLISNTEVQEMLQNLQNTSGALPENMSPAHAIHSALMLELYYGDDTALRILQDCDGALSVHGSEYQQYFADLNDKFVHELGDPRGLGFPTDPDYVADPNIRARVTGIDCDNGASISRTVHHAAPVQESAPAAPEVPQDEVLDPLFVGEDIPEPAPAPIEDITIHTNGGTDTVDQLTGGNPDDVKIKLPDGDVTVHVDGNADAVDQLTGGNAEPVRIKLSAELIQAVNQMQH